MKWRLLAASAVVLFLVLIGPQFRRQPDLPFEEFATVQVLPTVTPSPDAQADFRAILALAAQEPSSVLDALDQLAVSDSPYAESARGLAQAIRRAEVQGDAAYSYISVGQYLASLKEWGYAEQALQLAVEAEPTFAEAWAYLGEAQQQVGKDGSRSLRIALELDPLSLSANLLQALYWQRQNNYQEALRYLQIAALVEPDNPNVLLQLGAATVAAGEVPAARRYFERMTELAPERVAVWKAAAAYSVDNDIFVAELGKPAAARALQLDPRDVEALTLVGQAEFLLGNPEDAKTFYERALALNPGYASALLQLGLCYLAEGNSPAAAYYLELAIAADPNGPAAEAARQLLDS